MRWARRSAWLLGAATLVVAAAGLALMAWDWSTPVPRGFFGIRGFAGLYAIGFGGVGALLTWRRPGHPVGWILAAMGVVEAVDFATFEYGLAASAGHGLPGSTYAGWVQLWIWVPFVTLVAVYLVLLFPDGRLPSPRWRPVGWLAGGFAVIAIAGLAFSPGSDRPNLPGLSNPFGVAPAAVPSGAAVAGLAGLVGCVVLAVWSLVARGRRATATGRQQIKWLAWSGCLVAVALVPAVALSLTPGTAARVASGALFAAVLAMPAAVGFAVLRYRLYDIDRVISRTVAYAVLTSVLAGAYAGLVLLATGVFGLRTPVAVAAATLAAAALFSPVRRRVQHRMDRRFNRARYDAEATVAAFAARLKDAVDLDAVRGDLASVVQAALEPAHLSIWTSEPTDPAAIRPARLRVTWRLRSVPQEAAMMTAQSPADTRMMGIVHAAFRRDLARVRLMLTATPVPQGERRQAVADQITVGRARYRQSMRYLMLMWADADATSGDESDFRAWAEFDAQVKAAGAFVLNGALAPASTGARLVQTAIAGHAIDAAVERRPFAEGKRQIQAFYIMDLPGMDAALDWANRLPTYGCVEVRELLQF